MKEFYFRRRMDKPGNYYRSGLSKDDIRRAMQGKGWMTVTQVVGVVGDTIPPEAKARAAELHNPRGAASLQARIANGCRDLVRNRLMRLRYEGSVERLGGGKDAKYRWVESKDNSAGQDKA